MATEDRQSSGRLYSRQKDIPYSRYQAQGSFNEFFAHYPEELVDSLYSMWIAGGMPFVKSYDEYEYLPKKVLQEGGSRASYTHGSFKKGPMMHTDTLHVRDDSIDDFIAEMAHGLQYYMPVDKKKELKTEHYTLIDTVGRNISDYWWGSKSYNPKQVSLPYKDPNLERNPNSKEYVAHEIIEPWAYESWDILRILDEWLNKGGE